MYKSSFAIGLFALFCVQFDLIQGTILPTRVEEEDTRGDIIIGRLPLLFLSSSEIVNRQHGVAQGGNASCSNSSGFNIQSQSDLDALSSCTTVTGSITIKAVSMDSVTIPAGVEHVDGDISVSLTSTITTFSASSLQSISGQFELLNLTGLQTLTAPSLSSVGSISFVILPLLNSMSLGINEAGSVTISDTELNTLSGFSLSTVGGFEIGNSQLCSRKSNL
jgi:hypothetical protein